MAEDLYEIRRFHRLVVEDGPPSIPRREILLTNRIMDAIFARRTRPVTCTRGCPKVSPDTTAAVTAGARFSNGVGPARGSESDLTISVLTGGGDHHYAIPLCRGLASRGLHLEVVGSDQFHADRDLAMPQITFFNLHGNTAPKKQLHRKIARVLTAYVKLMRYAARTDCGLFHILWHNTFPLFDRTVLTAYYRLLGKRLVFTAHNVDTEARDGRSWWVSRWSLRVMYRMMDHIFVHTSKMKAQLEQEFGVDRGKITVIPFGMNTVPADSNLSRQTARQRLGLIGDEKVVLFFGNIVPYKGLEHLVQAISVLKRKAATKVKLVIAGAVKTSRSQPYWNKIERLIARHDLHTWVRTEIRYLADSEIEMFFKAADVCALPYVRIYQTGVMVLSYRYGVPVVATDAGSLAEDVVEGVTGFICRSGDSDDLARALEAYFASTLYADLTGTRTRIARLASDKYSWSAIASTLEGTYRSILSSSHPDAADVPSDLQADA